MTGGRSEIISNSGYKKSLLKPKDHSVLMSGFSKDKVAVLKDKQNFVISDEMVAWLMNDLSVEVRMALWERKDINFTTEQIKKALTDDVLGVKLAVVRNHAIQMTVELTNLGLTERVVGEYVASEFAKRALLTVTQVRQYLDASGDEMVYEIIKRSDIDVPLDILNEMLDRNQRPDSILVLAAQRKAKIEALALKSAYGNEVVENKIVRAL